MLLQALRDLAREPEVIAEIPRDGYKRVRVRYKVRLDRSGQLLGVIDLAEGSKPPGNRGLEMEVPNVLRTSKVTPVLFADGPDYTFGLTGPKGKEARTKAAHLAYKALAAECADRVRLPEVTAVVKFLSSGVVPATIDPAADAICFEVEDTVITDLPDVTSFWTQKVRGGGKAPTGDCLVCGEAKPIVSPWPVVIRGIPGGQTSGNQLVSANAAAFESYGMEASATSPTCYDCARESVLGLNWLLSRPDHHISTSNESVFVFWTRGGQADFGLATMMTDPRPDDVRELLHAARTGRRGAVDVEAARFSGVSLAPSGSRIAVRSWIDASVAEAKVNLASYFDAQTIIQPWGASPLPIGLRRLVLAVTRDERDWNSVHPSLAADLLNLAMSGIALPPYPIAAVLRRIRSEQKTRVSHARASLLKLALAGVVPDRQKEAFMQRLDPDSGDRAYLCGRLLAELEAVQRAALGNPKASLTDRYFGAASSAPATVFGPLLRNAQSHLGKLRRERYRIYLAIDRRLQDIASRLTSMPDVLTMKEQAVFALGYYHQKAEDRAAAMAARDGHRAAAVEPEEGEE
ncbi:MAG: type I-C CRISPR-associated protein Cas8c/Csd1 [Candidatus Dormibacteraceae bacterium]